jgi:hypothetical protein
MVGLHCRVKCVIDMYLRHAFYTIFGPLLKHSFYHYWSLEIGILTLPLIRLVIPPPT